VRIEVEVPEELIQAIAAAVVDRLRPVMAGLKVPAAKADDLMSVEQLAEYLGSLSKDSIYRKASANEIPFTRVGRLLRFRKADIDKWLSKRSVPDVAALSGPLPPVAGGPARLRGRGVTR
jgi:excisionase family DNA binding protein